MQLAQASGPRLIKSQWCSAGNMHANTVSIVSRAVQSIRAWTSTIIDCSIERVPIGNRHETVHNASLGPQSCLQSPDGRLALTLGQATATTTGI